MLSHPHNQGSDFSRDIKPNHFYSSHCYSYIVVFFIHCRDSCLLYAKKHLFMHYSSSLFLMHHTGSCPSYIKMFSVIRCIHLHATFVLASHFFMHQHSFYLLICQSQSLGPPLFFSLTCIKSQKMLRNEILRWALVRRFKQMCIRHYAGLYGRFLVSFLQPKQILLSVYFPLL